MASDIPVPRSLTRRPRLGDPGGVLNLGGPIENPTEKSSSSFCLGIKIGLRDWQEKVSSACFKAVEVSFQYDKASEYKSLFEFLKAKKIATGLHFWGTLPGDYLPSLAIDNVKFVKDSLSLFENTIQIARDWGFQYVLIHTFSADLWRLSPDKKLMIEDLPISWTRSWRIGLKNLARLDRFAQKNKVKLIVEGTPKNEALEWAEDIQPVIAYPNVRAPDPHHLKELGGTGIGLCPDLAHLTTWSTGTARRQMFNRLKKTLSALKPFASVLHLGTIKPPFVIDTGNGFTPQEEALGVFPNRQETLELLEIFRQTKVIVIPEPRFGDHLWHNRFLSESGLFNRSNYL